jgi:hypothetical protein
MSLKTFTLTPTTISPLVNAADVLTTDGIRVRVAGQDLVKDSEYKVCLGTESA